MTSHSTPSEPPIARQRRSRGVDDGWDVGAAAGRLERYVLHRFTVSIERACRAGDIKRVDRLLGRKVRTLRRLHAGSQRPVSARTVRRYTNLHIQELMEGAWNAAAPSVMQALAGCLRRDDEAEVR